MTIHVGGHGLKKSMSSTVFKKYWFSKINIENRKGI